MSMSPILNLPTDQFAMLVARARGQATAADELTRRRLVALGVAPMLAARIALNVPDALTRPQEDDRAG